MKITAEEIKAISQRQQNWADKNRGRIDQKRRIRMATVDSMSEPLRLLVHQYGLNVVYSFLEKGVGEARDIRHLVETVLDEFSPTRGSSSAQGMHHAREWRESA